MGRHRAWGEAPRAVAQATRGSLAMIVREKQGDPMPFWKRAATLLLAALASTAATAAYPDKPIRLVIGFPAGGPLDQHARLLTERLQAALGQPIIIDYKAGAGGTVGAQDVMKAPADGYTLMLANTGVMVINPAL